MSFFFSQRKFILLSDSQNDGSFIIHHFLALYIKGKDDLSIAQTYLIRHPHKELLVTKIRYDLTPYKVAVAYFSSLC